MKTHAHVMLATNWQIGDDPRGWFISEKFDGIRALWTGRAFVSREGLTLNAPEWFAAQMPRDVSLDGELWLDRQHDCNAVSAICGPQRNSGDAWRAVTFNAFDLPYWPGGFALRLSELANVRPTDHLRIVDHVLCESRAHLQTYFSDITENGGEGVILRHPAAPYRFGRSIFLRKLKPFAD